MDFAEKQLAKYGWVKGEGLGKSVKGASEPIKVCLKRDSCGVGARAGSEFTSNWWSKVFNQAAKSINIHENVEKGEVTIRTEMDSSQKRTRRHYGNHRKELHYGGFLSCEAQLTGSTTANGAYEEERLRGDLEDSSEESSEEYGVEVEKRLFAACGGRTAHKAARHGCKLNGKLQRLEDQEKALGELGFHESEQKEHSVKKRKCDQVTSDSKAAHTHKKLLHSSKLDSHGHKKKKQKKEQKQKHSNKC